MFSKNAPPIARRILKSRDPQLVDKDLKELSGLARDKGAEQVVIISGADVVFAPELSAAENLPRESRSEHWPVRYPLDSVTDAMKAFEYGIFFFLQGPQGMPGYGQDRMEDPIHREAYLQVATIVTAVESEAFYRGYHLAAGYGAGNCRYVLCHEEKRCQALLSGQTCIHPYKARPAMVALGLDAHAMVKNTGFTSEEFQAMLFGLVMVT